MKLNFSEVSINMVVGTSTVPTGIPVWGAVKKKGLFRANNSIVMQTALLHSALLWPTPLCLLCSSKRSLVFQLQPGKQSSFSEPKGSWLIERVVPARGAWLVHIHANEDSQVLMVWLVQKALCWLVRMEPLWSVKMLMEIKLNNSERTGKVSVLLVKIGFRELLYKGGLSWPENS